MRPLEPYPDTEASRDIAADLVTKQPGMRIVGFRPGIYLELAMESPKHTFAAAPDLGGWVALMEAGAAQRWLPDELRKKLERAEIDRSDPTGPDGDGPR